MCCHINQGFWRDLGGGGDPFWLHKETLAFKVLQLSKISDRSEQNSSKLR